MILSGSFTGRRYRVNGKMPADPAAQFAKSLVRNGFKAIDPESDRTRSVGWVNPRQILDSHVTWDKIVFGPHVVLGLRIDQRKVSRPILKARLAQAETDLRRERPGGRVGREERSQLARTIEADLMAKTAPVTVIQEVAWNAQAGALLFSSAAKRVCEEMEELFEQTFGLALTPVVPFTAAERWIEASGKGGGTLDRAQPLDLRAKR